MRTCAIRSTASTSMGFDEHGLPCELCGEVIRLASSDVAETNRQWAEGMIRPLCHTCAVKELAAEVYRPEGVAIWMAGSNRLFGGLTPTQMIDQGRVAEVMLALDAMASGAAT